LGKKDVKDGPAVVKGKKKTGEEKWPEKRQSLKRNKRGGVGMGGREIRKTPYEDRPTRLIQK